MTIPHPSVSHQYPMSTNLPTTEMKNYLKKDHLGDHHEKLEFMKKLNLNIYEYPTYHTVELRYNVSTIITYFYPGPDIT